MKSCQHTFIARRHFNASSTVENFIQSADHSAISSVSLESSIAHADAFRALCVLRAVVAHRLTVVRRRGFML